MDLDSFTRDLLDDLCVASDKSFSPPAKLAAEIEDLFEQAENTDLTDPIVALFVKLKETKRELNLSPQHGPSHC